jgi:hypothetical protein
MGIPQFRPWNFGLEGPPAEVASGRDERDADTHDGGRAKALLVEQGCQRRPDHVGRGLVKGRPKWLARAGVAAQGIERVSVFQHR